MPRCSLEPGPAVLLHGVVADELAEYRGVEAVDVAVMPVPGWTGREHGGIQHSEEERGKRAPTMATAMLGKEPQ